MFSLVDVGAVFLVIGICFFVYGAVVKTSPALKGVRDGAITVSLLLFGVHHIFNGIVLVGVVCILMGFVLIIKNFFYTDL